MKLKLIFVAALLTLVLSVSSGTTAQLSGKISPQGLRKPVNILVYLDKIPAFAARPEKKFVVDQTGLTFVPHTLVIPVGSTVAFPNNDKVDHNVFSLSRTKKFNFGSYSPGQTHDVTFDKPGIVELRCDLHAEMIAYILVMKSPYYALTDKKGMFKIDLEGLPSGKYILKTWHEKLKNSRMVIDLPKDAQKAIAVTLKRGAPGVLYK